MSAGERSEHLGSGLCRDFHGCVALARQVMQVCLSGKIVIKLPGLGDVVLRPTVVPNDGVCLGALRHACEEARLECADSAAQFLVERDFALHTVNAILGLEPVIAAGSLSRTERGILYGVLAAVSAGLGFLPAVRLLAQQNWVPDSESIVVEVSLGLRGVDGRAWVCASQAFLARMLTAQSHCSGQAQMMVLLEVGRTLLSVADLAVATEGDVVVFDGVAALPSEEPWPIHIRRGDVEVPALLRADGVVAAAASGLDKTERRSATKAERQPVRRSAGFASATADARVEIAAEIGRLQGATLASLLRGEPLDRGRGDAILLRRDGTSWAEGEILAVDGELAVRITRKLEA